LFFFCFRKRGGEGVLKRTFGLGGEKKKRKEGEEVCILFGGGGGGEEEWAITVRKNFTPQKIAQPLPQKIIFRP